MVKKIQKVVEKKAPKDLAVSENIVSLDIEKALSDRYLAYALSTITSRSLPDLRDGLKPVHRRILWAMRILKLYPTDGYKKCARVVGDVIGKYHPHGDSSVYEALVRQAQPFSLRYPLIDGQGNFGNIDGDSQAAMRYTESRLTLYGQYIMDQIEEDTVDFKKTYDGEEEEPFVMPSAFPNLLANGSTGIAVGMATSVPSFNMDELFNAILLILEHGSDVFEGPEGLERLVQTIPIPDFPTGGVIEETLESIKESYRTGRGGFTISSRWEVEKNGREWSVVISEIPYALKKGLLIENLDALLEKKKISDIADIRDESDENVRIRVIPRVSTVNPAIMMEKLFRASSLRSNFPFNLNVLDKNNCPSVLSLSKALCSYVDHRREVLVRRSQFRIQQILLRREILAAQMIVFLNLDKIIQIVRESDDPRNDLMNEFSLTQRQADYILETRLRSLRRLEEDNVKKEDALLEKECSGLERLIKSDRLQNKEIAKQIEGLRKIFSQDENWKRKTSLGRVSDLVIEEDKPESLPMTVFVSQKDWIIARSGLTEDVSSLTLRGDDKILYCIPTHLEDRVSFLSSSGRVFSLKTKLISTKKDEALRVLLPFDVKDKVVCSLSPSSQKKYLLVSSDGYGFLALASDLETNRQEGKVVMTLSEGSSLQYCFEVSSECDALAILSEQGKLNCFALDEIPVLSRGKGVRLTPSSIRQIGAFQSSVKGALSYDSLSGLKPLDISKYLKSRAKVGQSLPRGVNHISFLKSGV